MRTLPAKGERLEDGWRTSAPPLTFWRQPQSNSAGLDGDCGPDWRWVVVDPNEQMHVLGAEVYEHSDGTITVDGHIADTSLSEHLGWKLEQGVWSHGPGDPNEQVTLDREPPTTAEVRRAIAEERMRIGAEPPTLEPKVVKGKRQ